MPTMELFAPSELAAAFEHGPSYIRRMQPYVAGRPISAVARELGMEESAILKMASNENPLGMPERARRAIEATLAQSGSALYPDPDAFALKSAIEAAIGVPRSLITIGNGSNELIDLITRAVVAKGESVVVSEYAFSAYSLAIAAVDARAITVPARNFGHDLEAMLWSIQADTKLIFVANPNNPTGTFHDAMAIRSFLDRVPASVVVVLDEAYTEYLDPEQQSDVAELVARYPNLVVVRTFSKAYALAGLRVGFAVAQEGLSELLNRVRLPFNTSVLAQAAAAAAIGDTEFVARTRRMNREGLQQLYAGFTALRLEFLPSAGNFVLVRVGDAAGVFARLLAGGIIVRPVVNYGLAEWLRISVGLPEQNQRLLEALAR
jgi:histidinol-phosphate aminotransferase